MINITIINQDDKFEEFEEKWEKQLVHTIIMEEV